METIREQKRGKLTLRLVAVKGAYSGIAFGDKSGRPVRVEGTDKEDVWRQLEEAAGQSDKSYFGFDGARARFLRLYPEGFQGAGWATDERTYKLDAMAKLGAAVPLTAAATTKGNALAVLRVFQATNLVSPMEKAKLTTALRSPSGDAFVQAAAAFTLGDGEKALREIDKILRPFECANWTIATYLPFLWRPEEHFYLKPVVSKDFATRVGHRFAQDYQTRLEMGVYASLLDLVSKTEAELAVLKPRDRVDIQSFIWVVGAGDETNLPSVAAAGRGCTNT